MQKDDDMSTDCASMPMYNKAFDTIEEFNVVGSTIKKAKSGT